MPTRQVHEIHRALDPRRAMGGYNFPVKGSQHFLACRSSLRIPVGEFGMNTFGEFESEVPDRKDPTDCSQF